jgi:hypothetical protein
VLNGVYTVTPTKSGETFTPVSQPVTVNGANVTNVNFSTNTGNIGGRVTDAQTGLPIQGVTITYNGGSQTAITDQNGVYQLQNIAPGTYNVTASAVNYQKSTQSSTVTSGNTATTNFTLNELGKITGFVKNSVGVALSGATVSFSGGSVTTAADGSYTLGNVVPGSYNVTATAPNYKSSTKSTTVNPGQTTNQSFSLSPQTGGIKGKTTTISGVALQGVSVTVTGGLISTTKSTISDRHGNYSFSGLPVGSYTVTAAHAGYTTLQKSVTVSSNSTSTVNFAF